MAHLAAYEASDVTRGVVEKRALPRQRVLKNAKVVSNGTVLDGLLRNVSARGARVSMANPTALPDLVTLHLQGGAAYYAQRRWTLGNDSGFEFASGPMLAESAAARALPLHDQLCIASPAPVLAKLHAERCFGDPTLQDLATRLGEAHAALVAALKAMATRTA